MCDNPLTAESAVSPAAAVAESFAFRPFCSKRCKLLDLSRWLNEEYRVPAEPAGDGFGNFEDEDMR